MKFPIDFIDEVIRYMHSNDAWLAILKVNSLDNQHQRYFISLIGINGLPLMDLTYVTPTYEIKTHPLSKDKIGEIDVLKNQIYMEMNKKIIKIKENKKNMTYNFFQTAGLVMNDSKKIVAKELDEDMVLKKQLPNNFQNT